MLTEGRERKKQEEKEESSYLRGSKDTQEGEEEGEGREQRGGTDMEGKGPHQETRRHMLKDWR